MDNGGWWGLPGSCSLSVSELSFSQLSNPRVSEMPSETHQEGDKVSPRRNLDFYAGGGRQLSGSRAFLGGGMEGGSLGKAMDLLHIINKVLSSDP